MRSWLEAENLLDIHILCLNLGLFRYASLFDPWCCCYHLDRLDFGLSKLLWILCRRILVHNLNTTRHTLTLPLTASTSHIMDGAQVHGVLVGMRLVWMLHDRDEGKVDGEYFKSLWHVRRSVLERLRSTLISFKSSPFCIASESCQLLSGLRLPRINYAKRRTSLSYVGLG